MRLRLHRPTPLDYCYAITLGVGFALVDRALSGAWPDLEKALTWCVLWPLAVLALSTVRGWRRNK